MSVMRTVRSGIKGLTPMLALAWAPGIAEAAETVTLYQPIPEQSGPYKLTDFSAVKRVLTKEPAYTSKPRYTLWVLGENLNNALPMVWDESVTGKGYDTLYLDLNYDGDLTEAAEKFSASALTKDKQRSFKVSGIKAKVGPDTFAFNIWLNEKNEAVYPSSYGRKAAFAEYSVSDLPDRKPLAWGDDLKAAPVHQFGGQAVLLADGKQPGESIGRFEAGTTVQFWTTIAHVGDRLDNRLCFASSKVPSYGGPPFSFLRVLRPDGTVAEEVPFKPGCS